MYTSNFSFHWKADSAGLVDFCVTMLLWKQTGILGCTSLEVLLWSQPSSINRLWTSPIVFLSITFPINKITIALLFLEPFQNILGKSIAEIESIFILLFRARLSHMNFNERWWYLVLARGTETVPGVLIQNWWLYKNWNSFPQYLWQSFSNLNTYRNVFQSGL